MNTTHKMLRVLGLSVGSAVVACGGEVTFDGSDDGESALAECATCHGTAVVSLAGFEWLGAEDLGLDVDVCVGVSCGQALVDVAELPPGEYPEGCIADDEEVGCCFSSPAETMPGCTAAPGGAIQITMVLPLGAPAGTTFPVSARVRTMLGDPLVDLHGMVRLVSCGEGCVTGEVTLG